MPRADFVNEYDRRELEQEKRKKKEADSYGEALSQHADTSAAYAAAEKRYTRALATPIAGATVGTVSAGQPSATAPSIVDTVIPSTGRTVYDTYDSADRYYRMYGETPAYYDALRADPSHSAYYDAWKVEQNRRFTQYDDADAYYREHGVNSGAYEEIRKSPSHNADYAAWDLARHGNVTFDDNFTPWGYVEGDEAEIRKRTLAKVGEDYLGDCVYELGNAEDERRKRIGLPPQNKDKYYDFNSPVDVWLFEHGLPSDDKDYLSKKNGKAEAKIEDAYNAEIGEQAQLMDLQRNAYYGVFLERMGKRFLDGMRGRVGGDTSVDPEEILSGLLNSGNYDTIVSKFMDDVDLSGATENTYEYIEQKNAQEKKREGKYTPSGIMAGYDAFEESIPSSLRNREIKTAEDYVSFLGDFNAYMHEQMGDAWQDIEPPKEVVAIANIMRGDVGDDEMGMFVGGDTGIDLDTPLENIPRAYMAETPGFREALVKKYDTVAAQTRVDELQTSVGNLDEQIAALQLKLSGYQRAPQIVNPETGNTYVSDIADELSVLLAQRKGLREGAVRLENNVGIIDGEKAIIGSVKYAQTIRGELSAKKDFNGRSGAVDTTGWDERSANAIRRIERINEKGTANHFDNYYITAYMHDDEMSVFRYLANTQGPDAAMEHVEKLRPLLNDRGSVSNEETARRYASENPVIMTIATIFQSLARAVEGLATEISGAVYEGSHGGLGRKVEYNDPRLTGTKIAKDFTGYVTQDISATHGDLLAWLYGTGVSIGENALRFFTFRGAGKYAGVLSGTTMAGQVAASSLEEYMAKGASSQQALLMSCISAACEGLGEAVDVSALLKIKDPGAFVKAGKRLKPGRAVGRYLLSNGITEAGSEVVTEVADFVADWLVMQDRSEAEKIFNKAKASGKTDGAALFAVFAEMGKNAGLAGLGGLMSGLVLGEAEITSYLYNTGNASGARFGSRISTGANAYADTINAMVGLQNDMPVATKTQYAEAQAQFPEVFRQTYEEALKSGTAADPGTRMAVIRDIQSLGLNKEDAEIMTRIADAYMASPASLMSQQAMGMLQAFQSELTSYTEINNTLTLEGTQRRQRAAQRLTKLYGAIQTYQGDAVSARESGDLKKHAGALKQLRQAVNDYKAAVSDTQTSAAVQDAKAGTRKRKAADRVKNAADAMRRAAPAEAERQYGVVAEAVLAPTAPTDASAEAQHSGAEQTFYDQLHGAKNLRTPTERGIVSADGTIEAMVNGGTNNGGQIDGKATEQPGQREVRVRDGERGRNIHGAQKPLDAGGLQAGQADHKSGTAETVRPRQVKLRTWDPATREAELDSFLAAYNDQRRTTGSPLLTRDVEPTDSISDTAGKPLARAQTFLGGPAASMYRVTSSARAPFGAVDAFGRIYLRDTGDDTVAFHYGHENAHRRQDAREVAETVLDMFGGEGGGLYNRYLEKFNEHPTNKAQREELLAEFCCDAFGMYVYGKTTGRSVAAQLGMTDSEETAFSKAYDMLMGDRALLDEDEAATAGVAAEAKENAPGLQFSERELSEDEDGIRGQLIASRDIFDGKEPVASVVHPGRQGKGKAEQLQEIRAWMKSTGGGLVDRAGFGIIELDDRHVRRALNYINSDIEYAAFFALKHVLKRGELIGQHTNHKGRGYDTITIAAPVKINGKRGIMGVVIMRTSGNRYKTHRILLQDTQNVEPTSYSGVTKNDPVALHIDSTSYNSISDTSNQGNPVAEDSQSEFSDHALTSADDADTAIERSPALDLYERGVRVEQYMRDNPHSFDADTAAELAGIALRNGEAVGGRLADSAMRKIIDDMANWRKQSRLVNAFKSPIRVAQDMGRWRDSKTNEGLMLNTHASQYYTDLIFGYRSTQMAKRTQYVAQKMNEVRAIGADSIESAMAHIVGERFVTEDAARNAVTDGDYIFIPIADGGIVLDKKGNRRMIADSTSLYKLDDNVLQRRAELRRQISEVRNDDKPNKSERIRELQRAEDAVLTKAKSSGYRVVHSRDRVSIQDGDGHSIFDLIGARPAYTERAETLMRTLRSIYDEMYPMYQTTLVSNGYRPAGHRENYFPHIGREVEGINAVIAFLQDDLPIDIAGLTDVFTPGKPFAANLLERMGDHTEYDAVRGFNIYVNKVSDVIFLTPVVQRYRQFEKALRAATNGTSGYQGEKNQANTNMAVWFHEQANHVASKNAAIDRGAETTIGRNVFALSTKLSGIVGTAKVAGNISTAFAQLIPFAQNAGQMRPDYVLRGIRDTVSNRASGENGDGLETRLTFLVNRSTAIDQIATSIGELAKQKGMKTLFAIMQAIDDLTTQSVARGKYYECMERGMSVEDALKETDTYCMQLFADRSKGSKPNVFSSKVLSPFTQFQLEPVNQLWHWRDIHRENVLREYERILRDNNGELDGIDFMAMENQIDRAGVAGRDAAKILARWIALSLFGTLSRAILGRDVAFNPYGTAKDLIEDYSEGGVDAVVKGLGEVAEENTPFLGGFGDRDVPVVRAVKDVASALGDVKAASEEATESGEEFDVWKGLVDPALTVAANTTPGGNQLRKTITGARAVAKGGNYTSDGRLRYPIEGAGDAIKAIVFGPSAAKPQGDDWSAPPLSAKKTEMYREAKQQGVTEFDMFDFLVNGYDTSTKANEIASLAAANPSKREENIIASILGVEYEGDLDTAARKAVEERKATLEKDLDGGKKTRKQYDDAVSVLDVYLEMMAGR